MTVKGRLDRLAHIAVEPIARPAEPPTRALKIMLDAIAKGYLPIPPEHPDMAQVVARGLVDRDDADASPEARETAQRFLAGEHDA